MDEAAILGEATAKLMATVRRDSRAVPMAERERAQTLLHSVVVRPVSEPNPNPTDALCTVRML